MMKYFLIILSLISVNLFPQSWQVVGQMPIPVSGGQAVVHGQMIYILGGFSETMNTNVDLIQAYDPKKNTWTIAGQMKAPRADFIADIYDSSLFYAGGISPELTYASSFETWNFSSSPIILGTLGNFNRVYATGHIVNNKLYVFGGSIASANLQYMVEYDIPSGQITYSNDSVFSLVYPTQQMSVVINNNIYIFGGARGVLLKSILKYDIQNKKLVILPSELGKPRAAGTAVNYINNSVLIIGGFDETHHALSAVDKITLNNDEVEIDDGPSLNYGRVDPMAVNYNGIIYVFGGLDKDGQPVPQIEMLGNPTTVINNDKNINPNGFNLDYNYPNPFNPSTEIKFTIGKTCRVSLDVYSLLGEHVVNLTSKIYSPGNYTFTWNGRDGKGAAVPSGVYIYRLSSDYFTDSKKMVLLK